MGDYEVPRTGWTDGLCQDYDRGLAKWFASRLSAREDVRKAFNVSDKDEATHLADWIESCPTSLGMDTPRVVALLRRWPDAGEPVAWVDEVYQSRYTLEWNGRSLPEGTPLYTAPPAKPDGEPVAWRPEVVAFASLMERELRENDWKGGWKHCNFASLMSHVWEEARELQEALLSYPRDTQKYRERIASEGADIANMVMMVLDVRGALSPSAAPPAESEPAGDWVAGKQHLCGA